MTLDTETLRLTGTALLFLALGLAIGAAHILSLHTSVRWIAEGRVMAPIGLQLARHVAVGAALFGAVWFGGAAGLIAAATGVLAARRLLLQRVRADG